MVPGTIFRPGNTTRSRQVALAAPVLQGRVACVDLETTGGTAAQHRITEVGIVLLEDGVVVDEWSSLVNPCQRIPPAIQASPASPTRWSPMHRPSMTCARRCGRASRGGCSSPTTRVSTTASCAASSGAWARGSQRRFSVRCGLSRSLFAGHNRHNLDVLIERWGLQCAQRHRALGDAAVLPALLAAFEGAVGAEQPARGGRDDSLRVAPSATPATRPRR